jgi:hypothetical protein
VLVWCRAQIIGDGNKAINARCRILAENPIVAQLVTERGTESVESLGYESSNWGTEAGTSSEKRMRGAKPPNPLSLLVQ